MNDRYAAFHALHRPGRPLLLPNAWDAASAAALAAQGHPAIGTTSLGVAAAGGKPDAAAATRGENLDLARRLRGLPVLLTVDVEGGFSDDPAEVGGYVAELATLGVVGVNLEDGRPDGTLAPTELVAAKLAAARAAAPGLFLNARTDAWWLGVPEPLEQALHRARAYRAAGAHGFFVPGAPDDTVGLLAAEVGVPLNVLHRPGGPSLAELGRLGVARVSTGSLLFRAALGAALDLADAVGAGRDGDRRAVPSYGWVQELSGRFGADHTG
ncbi:MULTISPECIES: isocitrate lyase/phosphoenolpyruvate mutase family protein [Micromonospora]|uniref:Isocitrate lyase/phosphoenolpyruvate mutase family protein n=2 Tax=Micromonospora sicca TaxID=2202420 RepID=A0A317DLC7_9ACTN|nr:MULTISPECIES: isocitrate lyase/phosphoenolpyruvate mutase family protein [unclassified Micromonospora]MBM0230127.1 isocitrate lyase/phosphoenolpyruvate mutase family protein [Micromonospora sp. ATA51]PWR15418.1 isocitrate lyase/phosphoenolpyruvate mutase family protein [Micromonospora sp. 4G51]